MATLKQIEAARRNGAKSKGPVTDEGKQRSSQNSTKHGLTGKKLLVLSYESDEEFLAFVQEWEEKLKPVDDIERGFVLQAAAARWRLQRAWSLETGMLDMQMEDRAKFLKKFRHKEFESMDDSSRQADAFRTLVGQSSAFDAISRYETRLSREYDRAIKGLERIRALAKQQREEMRNEPKPSPAKPDPAAPPTAVPTEPRPLGSGLYAIIPEPDEPTSNKSRDTVVSKQQGNVPPGQDAA